jgi:nucleolar pre-ribosomal-associated protein 1
VAQLLTGRQKWVSLKQLIQDEVRVMLPEPHVLLKLLSSSGQKHKHSGVGLKRHAHFPAVSSKKLKPNDASEDTDIIISGIDTKHNNGTSEDSDKLKAENSMQDLDLEKDDIAVIAEIWGLSEQTTISNEPNNAENYTGQLQRSNLF